MQEEQRVHETETRSQPGDGSKADREAVCQEVSRRFTRSDDETRAGPPARE